MPPSIHTYEMAQVLPGRFRLPARMSVVPLDGGGLAVISPIRISDQVAKELDALGQVRFLIAPNLFHHLYLGEASARWPTARVLCPRGLAAKRPDLRIDGHLEDGLPPELTPTLRAVMIEGAPALDEHVFFHEPSQTLVVTDLVFHVTHPHGPVAHLALWLVGCHGKLAQSRAWRFFVKDRARAAQSARALLALPFSRVIVAHGEPVDSDAHAALTRALGWLQAGR